MRRPVLILTVTDRCNNLCEHCVRRAVRHLPQGLVLDLCVFRGRAFQKIINENSIDTAIITGGEPFILDNLLDYAEMLKRYGITSLHLQTNGTLLSDRVSMVSSLGDMFKNMTASISLYGIEEIGHDRRTRRPGSWEQAWAGIYTLEKFKVSIQIIVLLFDSEPDKLREFIFREFPPNVSNLVLAVPHSGRLNRLDRIPFSVRSVLEDMDNISTSPDIFVEGLPPCFLPAYFKNCATLRWPQRFIVIKPDGRMVTIPPFGYMAKVYLCRKCIFDTICKGVYQEYRESLQAQLSRPEGAIFLVEDLHSDNA